MNNLQLGAAILLIIVAVPLIVGYCWPTDSEIENTWTTENELDITPSIATRDIPIIDTYSGPNNNLWLYQLNGNTVIEPVGISDSPSNIPDTTVSASAEILTSSRSFDPADFTGYRYDIYGPNAHIQILKDGVPLDYFDFSSVSYYPDSASIWALELGRMVHINVTPDMRIAYGGGASPSNPVQVFYAEYTPTGKYVDFSKGFRLDSQQDLYWSNGLNNISASIWIKTDTIGSITVGPWDQGPSVTIITTADSITAGGLLLGSPAAYPFVEIEITHPDGIRVKGVLGADSFTDGTYSYGNVLDLGGEVPEFVTLKMNGTATYEIKRTVSEIGTGKGILNATITPYSYYPHYSWQVSLTNPASFGDSVTVMGTTYPVSGGVIEIPGAAEPVPIRDMAILSLQLDGGQHIYINGIEVWTGAPDPTASVILNGAWYVDVSIYDVEQGVKDHYLWDVGGFGLDRTGYCMVGIMTSLAMALAGGMYGRRSAGKAAIVLLISGMSAAAYYCFL